MDPNRLNSTSPKPDLRNEIESDDEDNSSRFPYPLNRETLNRTNSEDMEPAGKKHWNLVKDQVIDKDKKKWRNLVKSAQSNTKSFLGIDNYSSSQPNHSAETYRSLRNWNERVFKVMNNNRIFGGELKERKLDQYIDNLNEDEVDRADPFLYYKLTGGSQVDMVPKITVANMAIDGLKKLTKRKKTQKEISMIEPGLEDLEGVEMKPQSRRYMMRSSEPRQFSDDDEPGKDVKDNIDGPWDAFTHAFHGSRMFGVGFCGRLCDNDIDPDKKFKYEDLLKSIKQHRPYFTYWVTIVQVIVCLVSIFAYGLAPIGFSYELETGMATTSNLEKQFISYPVKQNFWIGPAAMDLVHLGAKYAPCMRNDSNVYSAIKRDINRERESACCIRNDRGGCVQTDEKQCKKLMSVWHKWDTEVFTAPSKLENVPRTSGSVCGLDPMFCADPSATTWPDDITEWPICDKQTGLVNASQKDYKHMYCEIIGRPCCIGIQGECVITTLEHCDLMRGYFHGTANLCSQVDCMQDVCGMIDFLHAKNPDQVYRLFTSIFIHAGILQLIVTVLFQLFILRDVEKLAGFLRTSIVYVASGVIGNLGSALFLPYQAEVGPLGSQSGIIACLFVEMFHAWEIYKNPWLVFSKLFGTLMLLFVFGFLPMIDNFANVFGFLSGLLLSAILFPDIDMHGRCRRAIMITICISITIVTVGALILLFYIKPIDQCESCKFFSCPFGNKYCLDMDFNITRLDNR